MPRKFRFGIVALCDSVYKDEDSHKVVIAGLYSGNVLTDGTPGDMRFALYLECVMPDHQEHDLDVQFWVGKKQVGGARAKATQPTEASNIAIMLPQFGLGGSLPATLQIRVTLDGGKPLLALEKQLLLRTDPIASPPQPVRSPRAARAKASKP